MSTEHISLQIAEEYAGMRLDQVLAEMCPQYSRARLQRWIKEGNVTVDGQKARQRDLTRTGQEVTITAVLDAANAQWTAEDIQLDITFEDEHIIVINKPAGLVVHPGAGNPSATLVNALLHHFPDLEPVPRAGIVQRLDKDTTGIMIVARTLASHNKLVRALQKREIKRQYRAIVHGTLTAGGTIDKPIGRHKTQRVKMAVVDTGKPAVTHYRVLGKYPGCSELQVQIESGRTHQIRVHLSSIKHPVVGDPLYSGRNPLPKNISPSLRTSLQEFPRQALHAESIQLQHPDSGEVVSWTASLPQDYQELLQMLKNEPNQS